MTETYVQIDYIIATGGSGCVRRLLRELPEWLEEHPGHLIYRVRVL